MILATKAIAYISVYTLCYIVLPFGIVLSVYATIRFPLWDHQIPVSGGALPLRSPKAFSAEGRVTQGLFGRRPVTQGLRRSRRTFFGSPKAPQAKYARSPKAFSNSETMGTQGPKA